MKKEFTMSQNHNQKNDQDKSELSQAQDDVGLEKTNAVPAAADYAKDKNPPVVSRMPARAEDQFTMGKRHR